MARRESPSGQPAVRTAHGGGRRWVLVAAAIAALWSSPAAAEAPLEPIRLGSVLDLEGRSRLLGRGMRIGLQAALHGRSVQGREIELLFYNDNYTPSVTATQTREALAAGVIAMVGNVGTPTATRSVPLLQAAGVPAIGFFTGADVLRGELAEGTFNVRASYNEEIEYLVERAREHGIGPKQFCAMAQNDAFGEAALRGLAVALESHEDGKDAATAVRAALSAAGHSSARNGLAPAGFFERESPALYHGYLSLKEWEQRKQTRCRIVLAVGVYKTIGRFQAFSRLKGEAWLIATLSFAGAEALAQVIQAGPPDDRVLMMQVVPPLDANLPLLASARTALGRDLGFISLEGYIVGQLVYAALEAIEGEIDAGSLAHSLSSNVFNIGGARLSFERDNQALHRVYLTYLSDSGWAPLDDAQWEAWAGAPAAGGIAGLPGRVFAWLGERFR